MDIFNTTLAGTEFARDAKPEPKEQEQHSTLCITDYKTEDGEHFVTYGETISGNRLRWYQVSIDEYVKIENALIELDYYLNHRN